MAKSVFTGMLPYLSKWEVIDTKTINVAGVVVIKEGFNLVAEGDSISISLGGGCDATVGTRFTSMKVATLRRMKQVAYLKFESNPNGDTIMRVVELY